MKPVVFNPMIEKLRGSLGGLVFRRYGDRTFLSRKPDMSHVEPSPAQRAMRDRFRQAVAYAHGAMSDPLTAQPYRQAAERAGSRAFVLAVGDYLAAPTIETIDLALYNGRPGDQIVIFAHDDFEVCTVTIRILDPSGRELESGPAQPGSFACGPWLYTAQRALASPGQVVVHAAAADRPGNCVESIVSKSL